MTINTAKVSQFLSGVAQEELRNKGDKPEARRSWGDPLQRRKTWESDGICSPWMVNFPKDK